MSLVARIAGLLLAGWITADTIIATGDEPVVYRSLRAEGHDRLDERDLPRYGTRVSHWGWEVRTKHFVVVSTVSQQQAQRIAGEMEATWAKLGQLADQWTNVHRQPKFGLGAVNVLVTDEPLRRHDRPGPGPGQLAYGPNITLSVAPGSPPLEKQLPQLRRQAVFAFFHVARQEQTLPDWVQRGIAGYIAEDPLPVPMPTRLIVPGWESAAPRGAVGDSPLGDDGTTRDVPDRETQGLWTRYFLQGNDARQAPAFFRALADTLRNQPQDPFAPSEGVSNATSFGTRPLFATVALDRLVSAAVVEEGVKDWLADPAAGQPVIEPEPGDLKVDEELREVVLVLKLARRFAGQPVPSIEPRVVEFRSGQIEEVPALPPTVTPWVDLRALYRRLAFARKPWATIDTDGSLLLSSDRARLARLFGNAVHRLQPVIVDDKQAVEFTASGGETLVVWLEDNSDQPARPIARVKRPSPKAEEAESPEAKPPEPDPVASR